MKDRKGRTRGIKKINPKESIQFEHLLRSTQAGRITAQQLESSRRIIAKHIKKLGTYRIHVYPSISVSKKPSEVRMGKGKGAIDHHIVRIKAGQLLFSIQGVSSTIAKDVFSRVKYKLPVQVQYNK